MDFGAIAGPRSLELAAGKGDPTGAKNPQQALKQGLDQVKNEQTQAPHHNTQVEATAARDAAANYQGAFNK
ncbi:MAG: hypothetical protein ACYCW6_22750 [Candidatus Xenobia bacterium]